jgi:PIN domain nuclease of toxin-antitoxin system
MGGNGMIVADTHVIIWDALNSKKLSEKAKNAIAQANRNDGIIFCEISLWEIAMLIRKKRIQIDTDYQEFIGLVLASNKYILYGLTPEIAELSVNLPPEVNSDPADRMIAATSILKNAALVTNDKNLQNANCIHTIW